MRDFLLNCPSVGVADVDSARRVSSSYVTEYLEKSCTFPPQPVTLPSTQPLSFLGPAPVIPVSNSNGSVKQRKTAESDMTAGHLQAAAIPFQLRESSREMIPWLDDCAGDSNCRRASSSYIEQVLGAEEESPAKMRVQRQSGDRMSAGVLSIRPSVLPLPSLLIPSSVLGVDSSANSQRAPDSIHGHLGPKVISSVEERNVVFHSSSGFMQDGRLQDTHVTDNANVTNAADSAVSISKKRRKNTTSNNGQKKFKSTTADLQARSVSSPSLNDQLALDRSSPHLIAHNAAILSSNLTTSGQKQVDYSFAAGFTGLPCTPMPSPITDQIPAGILLYSNDARPSSTASNQVTKMPPSYSVAIATTPTVTEVLPSATLVDPYVVSAAHTVQNEFSGSSCTSQYHTILPAAQNLPSTCLPLSVPLSLPATSHIDLGVVHSLSGSNHPDIKSLYDHSQVGPSNFGYKSLVSPNGHCFKLEMAGMTSTLRVGPDPSPASTPLTVTRLQQQSGIRVKEEACTEDTAPDRPVDSETSGSSSHTTVPHPAICTTIRYRRPANSDLEERRTHFCTFPGK